MSTLTQIIKKILNIALDKSKNNSAATVGMVNGILPFTKNIVNREYFEKFLDFTDANNYGLTKDVSGIVITSFHDHVTIPNRNIGDIRKDGLDVSGYPIIFFLLVILQIILYVLFFII